MYTKGEFISVPSKVNIICDFNKDVFVFINKEGKHGVISLDKNNTQLIRPKYDNITIISSNEFLVKYDDKYMLQIEKTKKSEFELRKSIDAIDKVTKSLINE